MKPKRNLQRYLYICKHSTDMILIVEAYWKITHWSKNNIKMYCIRENSYGYRMFSLFGLIYISHFHKLPKDVIRSQTLSVEGRGPSRGSSQITCVRVCAYWFYKNKNQFASSFHSGALTKEYVKNKCISCKHEHKQLKIWNASEVNSMQQFLPMLFGA